MSVVKVAAYARVSTDKDDQANSFENQVKYFTDFINREENWELVKIYSDEGISGTQTAKREGFKEMIEDALSGKIDFIITKEVSRFARNVLDSIGYTRKLKEHNIFVRFVLDGIDTSQPDAELRLTIMAALAQEESRKTSERVKWGQKRQMEKGVVFGRSMLGYKVEGGKMYLVEEEAEIVKLIFQKYTIEGKGTHIIARELKEAGIKPYDLDGRAKYKNDWSPTTILKILRNEKYVGDLCQKKTWTKSYLDHKKRYNRGEEDMVYIKDHHLDIAIIDRELWNATQEELQRRSPSAEQKSKHSNRYWGSGKIFCGVCGERFVNKTKSFSYGVARTWACANHVKAAAFRQAECSMSERASDRSLRTIVLYLLNALMEDKKSLQNEIISEISSIGSSKTSENAVHSIKRKIDKIEAKKLKLVDIRLAEEITAEEFKVQKDYLDTELNTLKERLSMIEEENKSLEYQTQKIKTVFSEIEKILSFNDNEIDGVLGSVLEKITVYEGRKIEVKFKDMPMTFRVHYKSTGKLDTYRTEILSVEVA